MAAALCGAGWSLFPTVLVWPWLLCISVAKAPATEAPSHHVQKPAFFVATAACVTLLLASLYGAEAAYVELFHIYYQPLIVIVSMLWLWGLDVRIFETRLIRYDVCFSNNDQKYLLSSRQLFQVGCQYTSGAQAKRALSSACFFCLKCFLAKQQQEAGFYAFPLQTKSI